MFTLTCAACRSCPTLQRAPQTRDCGATPPMPSPAWAQRTTRSQTVLMGEMAGRGAPQASLSPALGQTRARMGRLGDASTSGQSQVGWQLRQQGGMALLGAASLPVGWCAHWLGNTLTAALGRPVRRVASHQWWVGHKPCAAGQHALQVLPGSQRWAHGVSPLWWIMHSHQGQTPPVPAGLVRTHHGTWCCWLAPPTAAHVAAGWCLDLSLRCLCLCRPAGALGQHWQG